jgi:hypothetical protein
MEMEARPTLEDQWTHRGSPAIISHLPTICGTLAMKAEEGSYQHIKLLLEITNEYQEQREITIKEGSRRSKIQDRLEQILGEEEEKSSDPIWTTHNTTLRATRMPSGGLRGGLEGSMGEPTTTGERPVDLVPERRRERLEGLPRAVRDVVIVSGMCRKGHPIKGEKILGVREGKTPIFFPAKHISYMAGIEFSGNEKVGVA